MPDLTFSQRLGQLTGLITPTVPASASALAANQQTSLPPGVPPLPEGATLDPMDGGPNDWAPVGKGTPTPPQPTSSHQLVTPPPGYKLEGVSLPEGFQLEHIPPLPEGATLDPMDGGPNDWAPVGKGTPTWADTAADAAKSAGVGIAKGAIGLAGLPGNIRNGANDLLDWAAVKLGADPAKIAEARARLDNRPTALPSSADVQRNVEGVTGKFYQPQTTTGKFAESIGELAPGAVVGPAEGAAGVLGNLARYAVAPGITSEVAGELADKTLPPWAANAARAFTGIATAGIGPRLVTPLPADAAHTANVAALRGEGVPLTAGQRSDAPWLKRWENDLSPDLNTDTAEGFTRAALRRVGINADRIEHGRGGTLDTALTNVGNRFDSLQSTNAMQGDTQLGNDLVDTWRDYASVVPDSQRAPVIENTIRELGNAIPANGGALPGDAYKALRSRLSRLQRGTNDPELSDALGGLTSSMDDAMERSIAANNPSALGAWQQTRRQYRNLLVIEKAATASGQGAARGLIAPGQLAAAAKSVYGTRAYARGLDDFSDLAQPGAAVMTPLPDSGTAQRNRINSVIRAIGGLGGMAIGQHFAGAPLEGGVSGLLAGEAGEPLVRAGVKAAVMNPLAQGYLGNQLLAGVPGLLTPQTSIMGAQALTDRRQ